MAKYRYKNRKSKAYKEQQSLSILYLLPVLFIIAIVPLIVYAKIVILDGLEARNWLEGSSHVDFFSYYKALYFVIASYIGVLVLLVLYWIDKLDFIESKYYIPMGVYVFFVLLSFLFAADGDVALRGFIEMFQGVFVLVGYVLFMITIFNLVREEKHIKAVVGALVFVGSVIGFIGIGQYFGYDIFRTSFGQLLILPRELHPLAENITFSFADFAVYATLYNTNFVGSFAALMIPVSFALYFYQRKVVYVLLSIVFVGLMVFIGFGSNSRAGIIGVFAALLIVVIIFRREIVKKPLYIIIPFILMVAVGFGLNQVSEGRIVDEFKSLNLFEDIREANEKYDSKVIFEAVNIEGEKIDIITNKESIHAEFVGNDLVFETLGGERIETIKEGQRITFLEDKYQDYVFTRGQDAVYYNVRAYGRSFNIWLTIDGFMVEGMVEDLHPAKSPDRLEFLDPYESLFSGRVYIWSRSIPMLKDNIIIGAGPDMYPIAFPQDDFIGRLNSFGSGVVVDKAHNMYVQIGINTGLISLVAIVSVFGMYLIDSFKIYINQTFSTYQDYIGAGLFTAVTAYLVSGFFNDQIISVAPVFYAMLALGIAVNRIIQNEK